MQILNLTPYLSTIAQIDDGVFEPSADHKETIKGLLTFTDLPSALVTRGRAGDLANIAVLYVCDAVMIAGALYLMAPLEAALKARDLPAVYDFSEHVSEGQVRADGSVIKAFALLHLGFVSNQ